jgi:hypothetical protein
LSLFLAAISASALRADFSYQQTTQITGGSILQMIKMAGALSSQARKAGDPQLSTIYLKGDRMATVSPDSISIVDLGAETVTHIDLQHHTWYSLTFAEIRDRIERTRQKMDQHSHSAAPSNPTDVRFDVKVHNTGASKDVEGRSTHESILTLTLDAADRGTQQSGGMAITNDLWLTPEIHGYAELREFQRRYSQKLMQGMSVGMGMDFTRLLAQQPGATDALVDMAKELEKLHGVPVLQIMRMGSTADGSPLPAASEAPLPDDSGHQAPSVSDAAKQALVNRLPFGGFGRKKNSDDAAAQNAAPNANQKPAISILMEMQLTSSNFSSSPVDSSHFEIPAGFKQITAQADRY